MVRVSFRPPSLGALAFACSVFILALAACGRGEEAAAEAQAQPPTVQVVAAAHKSIRPADEYAATVESMETAAVRPRITATVRARHITPGAMVEEGDLLYELDDAEYTARLNQAKASLTVAEAEFAEAESNWKRAQQLKPQGHISAMDFDKMRAAYLTSEAQIEANRAAVEKAELELSWTKITAPFAGRIGMAEHAVGDNVSPVSQRPLFRLVRVDPIYVTAKVDQKVYDFYAQARLKVERGDLQPVAVEPQIELGSGVFYDHTGRFDHWDIEASGASGTIAARLVFPNPDGMLLPGQNVKLVVRTRDPIDLLTIPQRAVSQDQQGQYVLVVAPGDIVERRNLSLGMRSGADWVVREGLEEGERVIVEGQLVARPGIRVTAVQARQPG